MPKYRTELKHIISSMDAHVIRNRLQPILKLDVHAGPERTYFVRSLYFDTAEDKAMADKVNGIALREKYRIRFYDHDPGFIRLEKKSKINGSALKMGTALTKEQTEMILFGNYDFLMTSGTPLHRDFYLKLRTERLLPKVIVDYNREAYICDYGNVRITLDNNLRTSIGSCDLFNPNSLNTRSMDPGLTILEIKFDHYIPDFIRDIVQLNNCRATAVSKYIACRFIQ